MTKLKNCSKIFYQIFASESKVLNEKGACNFCSEFLPCKYKI